MERMDTAEGDIRITGIMENQMEKKTENEMETREYVGGL